MTEILFWDVSKNPSADEVAMLAVIDDIDTVRNGIKSLLAGENDGIELETLDPDGHGYLTKEAISGKVILIRSASQ